MPPSTPLHKAGQIRFTISRKWVNVLVGHDTCSIFPELVTELFKIFRVTTSYTVERIRGGSGVVCGE